MKCRCISWEYVKMNANADNNTINTIIFKYFRTTRKMQSRLTANSKSPPWNRIDDRIRSGSFNSFVVRESRTSKTIHNRQSVQMNEKNHSFFSSPYNGSTVIKNKTRKRKQIIIEWMANESLCYAIRFESFTTSCLAILCTAISSVSFCRRLTSIANSKTQCYDWKEKLNIFFFVLVLCSRSSLEQNVRPVHEFGSAWNEIGVDWDIHFKQVLFIFAFFGILFVSTIWFLFFLLTFSMKTFSVVVFSVLSESHLFFFYVFVLFLYIQMYTPVWRYAIFLLNWSFWGNIKKKQKKRKHHRNRFAYGSLNAFAHWKPKAREN